MYKFDKKIENNEIRDMERLHELKMPKCINFELDGNYVYRIQGVDLRHFAKFEPPKLALTRK